MAKSKKIEQWQAQKSRATKKFKALDKKLNKHRGKALDRLAEATHTRVFAEVDCLDCASCCTNLPALLKPEDVKRIAAHLQMPISKFETEYLRVDEDGDTVFRTTPCVFLEADNRCRIYAVRPASCRAYPHTDEGQFSKHWRYHRTNAQYCPASFHILEAIAEALP